MLEVNPNMRHEHRLFLLEELPKNSICAEIGVFEGTFSYRIMEICKPKKLYLIDSNFQPKFHINKKYFKCEYVEIQNKFENVNIKNNHFDWVYLDSTHSYEDTMSELELLRAKVSPSGLITGHDWQDDPNHIHAGVKKAVVEFCDRYDWELIVRDRFLNWAIKPRKRKRQSIL